MDVKKSERVPPFSAPIRCSFGVFRVLYKRILNTLKSCCYFWALDWRRLTPFPACFCSPGMRFVFLIDLVEVKNKPSRSGWDWYWLVPHETRDLLMGCCWLRPPSENAAFPAHSQWRLGVQTSSYAWPRATPLCLFHCRPFQEWMIEPARFSSRVCDVWPYLKAESEIHNE